MLQATHTLTHYHMAAKRQSEHIGKSSERKLPFSSHTVRKAGLLEITKASHHPNRMLGTGTHAEGAGGKSIFSSYLWSSPLIGSQTETDPSRPTKSGERISLDPVQSVNYRRPRFRRCYGTVFSADSTSLHSQCLIGNTEPPVPRSSRDTKRCLSRLLTRYPSKGDPSVYVMRQTVVSDMTSDPAHKSLRCETSTPHSDDLVGSQPADLSLGLDTKDAILKPVRSGSCRVASKYSEAYSSLPFSRCVKVR